MSNNTPVPYLMQGQNIILVIDDKSYTVSKNTHIAYAKIIECLKKQQWDELRECVVPAKVIVDFGKGFVAIDGDEVTWKGQPFHNALATRMIEMYQEGFPIDPMVRFMENLMENSSMQSVNQLYGFLEKNKLPITSDGYFLAFKRLNHEYKDVHTGKIDNNVGQIVEMDRNLVDDNPNSTCSYGLHFCSESYLGFFGRTGDPVMILKINPKDVVSIPADHNGSKGRCCRYEVVAQVTGDPIDAFAKAVNQDYSESAPIENMGLESTNGWPFPTGDDSNKSEMTSRPWPFPTSSKKLTDLKIDAETQYSVERVRDGNVEAWDLTLDEANKMVEKNERQKKAKLKIVKQ